MHEQIEATSIFICFGQLIHVKHCSGVAKPQQPHTFATSCASNYRVMAVQLKIMLKIQVIKCTKKTKQEDWIFMHLKKVSRRL